MTREVNNRFAYFCVLAINAPLLSVNGAFVRGLARFRRGLVTNAKNTCGLNHIFRGFCPKIC